MWDRDGENAPCQVTGTQTCARVSEIAPLPDPVEDVLDLFERSQSQWAFTGGMASTRWGIRRGDMSYEAAALEVDLTDPTTLDLLRIAEDVIRTQDFEKLPKGNETQ